jgi:ADP-heptose:LPS heptosyltransferase
MKLKKILIIQTAFIGDVVLATPVIERLHAAFPEAQIDFLLRAGNESLLQNHPFIHEIIVWEKRKNKYPELLNTILQVRKRKYDVVLNLQRFSSSGLITACSGAPYKVGFDKNPWSFLYSHKAEHTIGNKGDGRYLHEINRNLSSLTGLCETSETEMKLYPSIEDMAWASSFSKEPFITISPSSVWYTKQVPAAVWIDFISKLEGYKIVLLGGKGDQSYAEEMASRFPDKVLVMAGQLSFLRSAALMKYAVMNYVNDSAPLHFASSVDAPTTAVFCSTIPEFGFGPKAKKSFIVETKVELSCRPCGLHGKRDCPLGHFNCSKIETSQLMSTLSK